MPRYLGIGVVSLFSVPALAGPTLYGVRANGDLLSISTLSGAATFIGSSGVQCRGARRVDLGVVQGVPPQFIQIAGPADRLFRLASWNGEVLETTTIANLPPGYSVHCFGGGFVLLSPVGSSGPEVLASIGSGAFVVIGSTGRTDLESLAAPPGGPLYGLGSGGGGTLCRIDTSTGAATAIGGGGFGDALTLGSLDDGSLVAAGSNLLAVNAASGATTLIGPTGTSDFRGLAVVRPCIADCAAGGPPPQFNVNDFICFQVRFAAGDPYANCDASTTPPVLNVNDFICFMSSFASGCQ